MSVEVVRPERQAVRSTEPERVLYTFTAALASGDLAAASVCFTREACLITADRTAVHGRERISSLLAQMISRRTELVVEQVTVRRAGEVALAEGSWRLKCDAPEGSRFAQQNATTLVLHFVEGAWKIAVIAPWGSS